jgi:hippurate hydrolase
MRPSLLLIASLCLPGLLCAQPKPMPASEQAYLQALYLHLHQHPELSFFEKETAARLAQELRSAGFEVSEGIGGYGIVGLLRNGPGPVLLVRTDLDGLPVSEETGLSYASTVRTTDAAGNRVGVMHACGHDLHMTVWTGAARWLAQNRQAWQGTLLFIGQPAEERGGGAKAMLAEGLYSRFPKPDYALALHTSASLPAGTLGLCPEYAMANVDMVDITVYGKGGHGAYPHTTQDPIVLSAQIILALQTIVSRETNPLDPAVVTVGSIQGGSKGNIIGDEVRMELTLRSYRDEVRNALIQKIERICRHTAQAAGIPEDRLPVVTVRDEHVPALYNNPVLTERIRQAFERNLGPERVKMVPPVMGGEDFSRYGSTPEDVPVLLFWLGAVDPQHVAEAAAGKRKLPSLHSPQFAPLTSPSIETGVSAMLAAVLELCGKR